jgi:hypothetical protein
MVLEGNAISCDGYGCLTRDDFDGELAPDDILVRYHILGWSIAEIDGRMMHFCPEHS